MMFVAATVGECGPEQLAVMQVTEPLWRRGSSQAQGSERNRLVCASETPGFGVWGEEGGGGGLSGGGGGLTTPSKK